MTDAEARILENQVEILWTLNYLVAKAAPDLVGRGGELDRMRDDLAHASKKSRAMIDARSRPATAADYLKPVDQQQAPVGSDMPEDLSDGLPHFNR